MKPILIFDLDGTIDNEVLHNQSKKNKVMEIMKECNQNNGYIYIVTARRSKDFNYSLKTVFSYNIPSDIVKYINDLNKDKSYRWLYYNKNIDIPQENTYNLLNHKKKFKEYNLFTSQHNVDIINFNMGIQKMLHIHEIINRHKNEEFYVVFFDDALYNKQAWDFYKTHINPDFKAIYFIGGKNKNVF